MTPPTLPPEIEAAIINVVVATDLIEGEGAARDALRAAIATALHATELRGRAAGRDDALAQAPEVEASIKALEADTFEHGKCPGTPRGLDLAAAREFKRNALRAAIAADKARAVEAAVRSRAALLTNLALADGPVVRPVLSREDADALIDALGRGVRDLWRSSHGTRERSKALDDHDTARAALLAALTGAGGGR